MTKRPTESKKRCREGENRRELIAHEAEVEWEELQEDPAAQGCKQLLARLDEEEEKEEKEKEEKEEDHQRISE